MIRLKDAEKTYENGTKAVRGISFQIDDGEFVFLVGPSGSGKSTIIKMLTGEIVPTGGRVMVNGFSMSRIKEKQLPLMRRTIGVIFQDFRLIEKKTVYENLSFAMRAVGSSPREAKKRIPYVLKLVGLDGKANQFPNQLSGGEQQRVAIARALAKRPRLLLCDEPTGALDYQTGKQILALLQKQSRENGMTVVIITHNSALTAMADRVIRVRSGQITDVRRNEAPVPVESIEW